jgi:hypothetical protein
LVSCRADGHSCRTFDTFGLGDEFAGHFGFEVRFDSTIPAGAPSCHFTMWKASDKERQQWEQVTQLIEAKALDRAKR